MIEFRCPHCKELFTIPEEFVGTAGTCRKCAKPITIEVSDSRARGSGTYPAFTTREPTLAIVHIETTGSSSRKNSIIELGSVIIDLDGNELDTFWSFANPSTSIPDKMVSRTGIADDMVADALLPNEVVQNWFSWLGNHALVVCQHSRFHAKFLSAALLNHDIDPPIVKMIDVVNWSRDLALPVEHYRLRNLLEHIGYTLEPKHRSMDVCRGLTSLLAYLARKQVGVHLESEGSGMVGLIRGRKIEAVNRDAAFAYFEETADSLDEMCGPNFVPRVAYEQRKTFASSDKASAPSGSNGDGQPAVPMHMGEWFAEMKVQLEDMVNGGDGSQHQFSDGNGSAAAWRETVWKASDETDPEKQLELCVQAIRLGALDPWPYENLVDTYIHAKNYDAACKVAGRYFRMESWKNPKWAEVSLKLLKRLSQLENHLAKHAH